MNVLLVQPQTPVTFWSFHNALKFIGRKSCEPPLGLMTIASMLPKTWDLKLVDMNISPLKDKHILWANYVFLTGMSVHMDSMKSVIRRCNSLRTKVVAGGPLCTLQYDQFEGVAHFILNEAEVTLPLFLKDLKNGIPKHIYRSNDFPNLDTTPIPMWSLIDFKKYSTITIQYSRGCPYDCEFCGIARLNGRKPRTKSKEQIISELESLYTAGWREGIFIVDDNFIGNKRKLKYEILPALAEWLRIHKYPFTFMTEVSINLADDDKLIDLMLAAGFNAVFIGIETPISKSLEECGKRQNQKRNLISSVKKLQRKGIVVSAGFIVGFDNDPEDIFDRQIEFIQQSGIAAAMVGLLNAPSGSRLFKRLKRENRLVGTMSGDNMDGSMNFIPQMDYTYLSSGYKRVVHTIYSQSNYFRRLKTFLREYGLPQKPFIKTRHGSLRAFLLTVWVLGVREKGKNYFWKLIMHCLVHYPRKIPIAVELAIYGFHFRKVAASI